MAEVVTGCFVQSSYLSLGLLVTGQPLWMYAGVSPLL